MTNFSLSLLLEIGKSKFIFSVIKNNEQNNFNNILQTVSSADIINKQFIETSPKYKKIPIIFGDCKNRDIEKLAFKCNVPFNGVSFFYQNINSFFKNNYLNNLDEINLLISEVKINYLD